MKIIPPLDGTYSTLPARFFARVQPAQVPAPKLLAWNDELARELGLHSLADDEQHLAQLFSGNELPSGADPIAMAYAGHQFAHFVPQLGDGRAILLGEAVDRSGRRFDVQLKGAGRTPFSRGGDGKSWIGPVIREYLVSEAMHHLGVPTTRALAAVFTGEPVYREKTLPGGVFTRVAASHIRVGTFQYFAARGDADGVRVLADYATARHYPVAAKSSTPYLTFFASVVRAQAELVAQWMRVGFIHGVMNTDNTTVSGETIDYGPCAFMDEFDVHKVFSSIDRRGRYAYSRQPGIAQWNLARLAESLLTIDDRQEVYEDALAQFGLHFERRYLAHMRAKFGLATENANDAELFQSFFEHLQANELDFALSFRRLAGRIDGYGPDLFGDFESKWRLRLVRESANADAVRVSMNAVNPLFIPRNHQVERAISAAVDGDLTVFNDLRRVIRQPFSEQPEYTAYALSPQPQERVTQTFCGT